MTTRRPIGAALLLTMVCLNGCYNFAAPIDPTPTIALDPKLLGSWRCLNGDTKQDEPPATLMFTRARDNVYAARLDVPKEKPGLYEAFASRVKDQEFLSVRDLGDQAKFPWYVVHYEFLKPNVLDLQLLDEDKVTEAERSAASLRPVLERHMGEPELFSDFVTCVRASDEASTTTVLDIGDLAPPLDVETWLQGTPIAAFETGKVYVLDFLAPWCAPCLAMAPHLSALQDRLGPRGVQIIGVMGPDTLGTTRETAAKLVEKRKDALRIPVAFDRLAEGREPVAEVIQGRTMGRYMTNTGIGLPGSVVIDGEGRVAWLGLPSDLSPVLESILAGTWNRHAFGQRWRTAVAAEPRIDEMLTLLRDGKASDAMTITRELIEGPFSVSSGHLRLIVDRITNLADDGVKGIDMDLTLSAALRADKLSEGIDPTVIASLARARFVRGEFQQAIEAQERAVARSLDETMRPMMEERLQKYRQAAVDVK